MSDKTHRVPGSAHDKAKADRLAEALRANLKRRKTQARGQAGTEACRLEPEEDENPQGTGEKQR